jgi:hypothetical protein
VVIGLWTVASRVAVAEGTATVMAGECPDPGIEAVL